MEYSFDIQNNTGKSVSMINPFKPKLEDIPEHKEDNDLSVKSI
jgi:hypothetical protein